jgi:hypothetical protein
MKLPSFTRYHALLFAAVPIFALGSAEGALTLTIDTLSRTFIWSGTVTTDELLVNIRRYESYRIGTSSFNGGSTGIVAGAGALTLTRNGMADFTRDSSLGEIYVTSAAGLGVWSTLGSTGQSVTPSEITFTLTGDGIPYAYATGDTSQALLDVYASLDGQQIHVQRLESGSFGNLGSAIGQVVVVPEPSGALLLLVASGLLLRRRRS